MLHYTFDDGKNPAKDSSGKGNHGQLVGNPDRDDRARVGGGMLNFDGKDDFVKTFTGLKKENFTQGVTYSLWIRSDDFSPTEIQPVVPLEHYSTPRNILG